jgi:hypothetical protein
MKRKKRLIRFNELDSKRVLSASELTLDLCRKLKKQYEQKQIYIDDSIIFQTVRENLILYLSSKKRLKFEELE